MIGEVPVAIALLKSLPYITKLIFTGDKPIMNNTVFLEKRRQENPDLIATLQSNYGSKETYLDIKSGMDIFKSTTRGHIGIVTYMQDKIIPTTRKEIPSLAEYNHQRLLDLESVCKADNSNGELSGDFLGALKKLGEFFMIQNS